MRPNKEGSSRNVFVISSVPLDLTVDHLISWERLQIFFECWKVGCGVAPLNTSHMRKVCNVDMCDSTLEQWVSWFKEALPLCTQIKRSKRSIA